MLIANLLFIVGILCLVAAGVGLVLIVPQRTRTAGIVVCVVFGAVGVAATAMAVLQGWSSTTEADRASRAMKEYEARAAAEAEERQRALRKQAGWADDGYAFVTGSPLTAKRPSERVQVYEDAALTRQASCTFRHGVTVSTIERSQSGVPSVHVKSGECEGWLPVANVTNARPRPLTSPTE